MVEAVALGFLAAVLVAASVGRRQPVQSADVRPDCAVSILLIERDGLALSNAIDASSGALGFSHVAWDACESIDGEPVGIDCRPGYGVHRRPLADILKGRRHVRIFLPLLEGREAYGCARSRVGESYDGLALFTTSGGGRRRGTICSELIWECLPESLRDRIPPPEGRPVAPNDIAQAFGITGPNSKDVQVS